MNVKEYNDQLLIRTNKVRDSYKSHEKANLTLEDLLTIVKSGERKLSNDERSFIHGIVNDSKKAIEKLRDDYHISYWNEHYQHRVTESIELFGLVPSDDLTKKLESSFRHHVAIYVHLCNRTLKIVEEMKQTIIENEFNVIVGNDNV